MDSATLRWIIIAIGAVILISIFLFGNPERKRKPRASRRKPQPAGVRREPTLCAASAEPGTDARPEDSAGPDPVQGQAELPIDEGGVETAGSSETPGSGEPAPAPRRPSRPTGPPPDRIVTLFLLARDNHVISGAELLEAAIKTGLEFGDLDIFHRQAEGSDQPLFSLANAVKPGYFDRDAWNTFETKALAVFMPLPGPMLALDAWDAMLASTRRLSEILNAEIQDDQHEPFTRQKEVALREEMRVYDREQARKSLS
ncbi:cell division protein ZipA [Elongatibacter sediminis]|uniref:Cell division protein ZipA n=1 Tax=Elongatibacter sediminis TaxID=3119006 RepID=A0AAW9RGY4_9GAMM